MNLHDFDIMTEAAEEATLQKAQEDARNLLKMNVLTPEQIAQAVGLPLDQVLELQKKLAVGNHAPA
ncbi:MAG: hypothetical protein II610_03055 [Treponema sp.]|nr:hypothetical protein [Treponema sp.]